MSRNKQSHVAGGGISCDTVCVSVFYAAATLTRAAGTHTHGFDYDYRAKVEISLDGRSKSLHFDRVVGGHCDHRDSGRNVTPGFGSIKRTSSGRQMLEQLPATHAGLDNVC